ncbi:MAG TPA: MFS transporter [Polyangiaceae bacterium]
MTMRDRIKDPNIFRVYRATFALGLAYGMAISLIAVFLDQRGFHKTAIGSLAAWFAGGIVLLSLPMAELIRRYSAKTTLVAALFGYALTVSAMPYLHSYGAIALVRLVDGACSVGVWVSCETILLQRSGPSHKAYVTSLYAVTIALGYLAGPLFARGLVMVAPFAIGFSVAGVIALLASGYVALKLDRDLPNAGTGHERSNESERADDVSDVPARGPLAILWRIKTCCYATFAYGYFQASVVLFLPLYLMEHKGIEVEQTILIPAFFAAGMLLFSNFGGRIGDKLGHLGTMRHLASVGVMTILGFVFLDSYWLMAVAVFVAGATLATISPLSLALQGVVVTRPEYARANSLYNAFYAVGMLLGPPISSTLFTHFGGAVMLYHLAALWAGFVAFALLFYRDDPAALRRSAAVAEELGEPAA